jgi:AraC-like DNA-binding protein
VLLAAYLPTPLVRHFRAVFPEEHDVLEADSWANVGDIIRRRPIDLAIVDPVSDGALRLDEITNLLERYPSLPVLVYTTLVPGALKAASELARRGVHQMIIHRFDDSPARFKEVLDRTPCYRLGGGVLDALAEALGDLPAPLARAVEQLFEKPHLFSGAVDLISMSGIPAPRLYRRLKAVRILSPRRLFIAARVLRGYAYMRDPGYTVGDIAAKLGYSDPRVFTRHTLLALSMRPTEVRKRLQDDELVSRLVEWIYTPDEDPNEGEGYEY